MQGHLDYKTLTETELRTKLDRLREENQKLVTERKEMTSTHETEKRMLHQLHKNKLLKLQNDNEQALAKLKEVELAKEKETQMCSKNQILLQQCQKELAAVSEELSHKTCQYDQLQQKYNQIEAELHTTR